MSPLSIELDTILKRVDRETATQLEQAVRDAIAIAQQGSRSTSAVDEMGYPLGYFESTAGSFEGEPLERE
jgi:hypothetical protein